MSSTSPGTLSTVVYSQRSALVSQSFTQSLKRRMSLKNTLYACGVTYEIVSNIPKVLL